MTLLGTGCGLGLELGVQGCGLLLDVVEHPAAVLAAGFGLLV